MDTALPFCGICAISQECLDNDRKPSPDELDGARAVAVAAAAWESMETGGVVKVVNAF